MTDTTLIDSDQSSSQQKEMSSHRSYDQSQVPVPGHPPGYGWNPGTGPPGSPPYYLPHHPQQYPPQAYQGPAEDEPRAKKRSSKGKDKEKERAQDGGKGKARANKEKPPARASSPQPAADAGSGSGGSQGSATGSFRVKGYVNDPTQGPVPMAPARFTAQRPREHSPEDEGSDGDDRRGHDRRRDKARRSRKERHYTEYPPPPPPHGYPSYPPPYPYPYPYVPQGGGPYSSQETYYPNSQSTHRDARYSPSSPGSPRSRRSGPSVASSDDPKKPRMVTLLINDSRTDSCELAEVGVRLKPANGGYWADAKEISGELQGSASKIDGPARVYAMRGKYKQVFLRVSADGEETFNSANLKIGTDKTVEVFVEYIAPFARQQAGLSMSRSESIKSGSLKRRRSFDTTLEDQPQSPSHASSALPPDPSNSSAEPSRDSSPMEVEGPSADPFDEDHRSGSPATHSRSNSQESEPTPPEPAPPSLFATPPPDADFAPATPPLVVARSAASPIPTDVETTPVAQPPAKRTRRDDSDSDVEEMSSPRGRAQTGIAPAMGFGGFSNAAAGPSAFSMSGFGSFAGASPGFGVAKPAAATASSGFPRASAAQSPLDMAVGKHLKGVFSQEAEWKSFQDARNRSLTVAEQVEQYRYLQRKLDTYVGQAVPAEIDGATGQITKEQVMRAFGLPAAKADECREVLRFTDMYGPSGRLTKDPEAVKMFYEPSPISTNIQIGRYLDLMRGVHARWTVEHPRA